MDRNRKLKILLIFMGICLAAGAASAGERFVDNGDGTVTDHQAGMMWSQSDNQGDIDWNQAEKWALFTFPYTVGRYYENWRLPTLAELQNLVADGKKGSGYETDCGQRVNIVPLIQLSCGWVWTAETDPTAPTARVFNFDNVYHYTARKAHKRGYRALAVRNID